MSAQWVVTFHGSDQEPELVVADVATLLPENGALVLATGNPVADPAGVVIQAVYPPNLRASVRRLPDPPGGGLYARARAGLRWLFT